MKVRPAALIIENNHVLLLRYSYGNQDVYALMGGNTDEGESLSDTLIRELREELNIEIEVGEMLLIGEVIQPSKSVVLHCIFSAKIIAGLPHINPHHTTALDIGWLPIEDLKNYNLYPNIGHHIIMQQGGYVGKIEQPFFE